MAKKSTASSVTVQELYLSPDGEVRLDVPLDRDTVWLSQAQLSELFDRDVSVISRHVRNVFAGGELVEKSNLQKMQIAGADRPTTLYSLDVIISVGYRVKPQRGTQFRIWATAKLKDYLLKGYALNQRRLEQKGVEIEQAVKPSWTSTARSSASRRINQKLPLKLRVLSHRNRSIGTGSQPRGRIFWLLQKIDAATASSNINATLPAPGPPDPNASGRLCSHPS